MSGPWPQYAPGPNAYQSPAHYGPAAGYPQAGFQQAGYTPQPGYPQSHPQQPFPPQVYPPQGYPSQGYPSQGNSQHPHQAGFSQSPQGHLLQGGSPHAIAPYAPPGPSYGRQMQQQGYPHGSQYGSPSVLPYSPYPNPTPNYPTASYQHSHHPQSALSQSQQHTSQTTSPQADQNCFNCGAPDHWAQDCPEPRRAVPYGQTIQANRAPRKARPGYKPPVITKYAVPPHVAGAQPTPPYTVSPSWSHLPPYPTPSTTVTSPAQQWPGQSPQQSEAPKYPQATTPDSQENRCPSASVDPRTLSPPCGPDTQVTASLAPLTDGVTKDGPPPASEPMSRNLSKVSVSTNQSVSMVSDSEDEEDEYLGLDIPDLPNLACYNGAKAPQLTAKPLPAVSFTDELGQLIQSDGEKIRSQYHDAASMDLLEANVRNLSEFEGLEDDPMFQAIIEDKPKSPNRSSCRAAPVREQHRNEPELPTQSPQISSKDPSTHTQSQPRLPVRTPPESPIESRPRSRRGGTPVNKREYHEESKAEGFDPFDPATGNLDSLIRKHYADATPKKTYSEEVAPPPPPPPPEPYPARNFRGKEPPDDGNRRRSSVHSPDGSNGLGSRSHVSPSERSVRKRKHNGEDTPRREGQRQRDTTAKRRTAPQVAEVYSRRW